MKQWVMDIPQYAEKLLAGLDEIDHLRFSLQEPILYLVHASAF